MKPYRESLNIWVVREMYQLIPVKDSYVDCMWPIPCEQGIFVAYEKSTSWAPQADE